MGRFGTGYGRCTVTVDAVEGTRRTRSRFVVVSREGERRTRPIHFPTERLDDTDVEFRKAEAFFRSADLTLETA